MAKLLKCKIQEQDAVKNVTVKVDKMYKNVKHVKEKVLLFKCIKWVLECINKFKNTVINAKDKDKLLLKEVNVKVVMVQRFLKKLKPLKYQYKKEYQTTSQLLFQDKVIKSLMLWLVI